jgi:hypothetical protein
MMVVNLHPWLIGQPFRIGYLDEALGYVTRRKGRMGRDRLGDC